MIAHQESNIIQNYFKIPFSELIVNLVVDNNLTLTEFYNYVNVEVRQMLNIHSKYYIEIVESGKPDGELASCIEPRNDETLLQRYGTKQIIAFYARPVNPETRVFTHLNDYSI